MLMSTNHLTGVTFKQLGLHESLLQGIEQAGFSNCTPIQAKTIPLALSGQDIMGQAQTGTGKTAAFLLAAMHRLLSTPVNHPKGSTQPRVFILAPTRELAVQIYKDAELLNHVCNFNIQCIYGGADYEKQRLALQQGVDILIATPGRAIDYLKQKVYSLKGVEVMVLDEADRMFDMGFIKDIRFLLRRLPPPAERLSLLFSATLSYRVAELAYEHMNNPTSVLIEAEKITADKLKEQLFTPSNAEKIPLLLGLLQHMDPHRTLIFVNTKEGANRVWAYLEGNQIHAAILSGDVPQKKRLSLLNQFQQGELPVLVATDVAARGLHIPDVSHVINFDLPQDGEDYVHRIGRTARAGASGDAISFACEGYAYHLMDIQEYIGYELPRAAITEELLATPLPPVKRQRTESRHPHNKHGSGRSSTGSDSNQRRKHSRPRRKPPGDSAN